MIDWCGPQVGRNTYPRKQLPNHALMSVGTTILKYHAWEIIYNVLCKSVSNINQGTIICLYRILCV